ncbi:Transcription factor AP-4, partial [Lamellibrachia satsuma]
DQDKRMRREIANCNERRRMQSINSGFQSLKTLLPQHDSEKLSKAAILQQTSEYISSLEQEKKRLQMQNAKLKLMLQEMRQLDSDGSSEGSPLPKRKKRDTESSDEGISLSGGDADDVDDMRHEMVELRRQLEHERHLRVRLQEQTQQLETQLYPERHLRQIASHVEAQMRYQKQQY